MATPTKTIWESKTLWVNVIAVAIIALQIALNQQLVPVEWQELALAILNILLRLQTSTKVTLS